MKYEISYSIFSLGDSAITVEFSTVIDESVNRKVLDLFNQLREQPLPGMIEAIPAYTSLSIQYDFFQASLLAGKDQTAQEWMKNRLEQRIMQNLFAEDRLSRTMEVPVCFTDEFAPDLKTISLEKKCSIEEVQDIFISGTYRVYMLGFLPGFAYMGTVDERIAISRKAKPTIVAAGSVGIAGRQTGIYPSASPGGWQIIGRTPLQLFNPEKANPALFNAGDVIKFISITKDEFKNY